MPEVFVGRQPIYDRDLDVIGYELLFRNAEDAEDAVFRDGDQATSLVILTTFREIGVERVVGERLAFLNLTRGFLVGEYPLPIPSDNVVLEVLEDIAPDREVVAGVERLKRAGFRIALDDYAARPDCEHLIALADIIKVDCAVLQGDELRREIAFLKPFGAKLLAEKVENFEEFERYLDLGFDFFQGFFLSRPKLVRGRRVPANRAGLMRILSRLHDSTVQLEELAEVIAQDVTLSYDLLRHVNSALYGLQRRVDAVHDTLVILGTERVRAIASLLLLANIDDRPTDLIRTSLLRARMCELVGLAKGGVSPHVCFTAGLLSTLDALLETPLPAIVSQLPLSEEVAGALLEGAGSVGDVLTCTLAYERGDWSAARCDGLSVSEVKEAFLEAVAWSESTARELSSPAL